MDTPDIYASQRIKFIQENPNFRCNPSRLRILREGTPTVEGMILYCMYRDYRVEDNWAMIYSQEIATKFKMKLGVFTSIDINSNRYSFRHLPFIFESLKEVEKSLNLLDIPFFVYIGDYVENLLKLIQENINHLYKVSSVVIDCMPTIEYDEIITKALSSLSEGLSIYQVDAHNVVPFWIGSNKKEHNARTFRAKVKNLLPYFLTEFPPVFKHEYNNKIKPSKSVDMCWKNISLNYKNQIKENLTKFEKIIGGYSSAVSCFENFLKHKLQSYEHDRNDPCELNEYELSPWINFGNLAVQRVILQIFPYRNSLPAVVGAFLEDTMTRRELADNLFYYSDKNKDFFYWGPNWAIKTLEIHENDPRKFIYSLDQLEHYETSDPLWNALTKKLVLTGKMNRYLRYYWAKKPIEWSSTPHLALQHILQLSKKYYMGGYDPEHIVGCLYATAGIHDRPWKERPIYGKLRFMTYEGYCKKINIEKFINYCSNMNP